MDRRLQDRIDAWLPEDLTSPAEIQRAIEQSGFSEDWSKGTTNTVANWASDIRDLDTQEIRREARRKTTVMGKQDDRQAAIRAEDGTTLGDPDNVKVWEDRWGNIMGHNVKTDTRKKITDSEDRE